jgi:hypothetical protein
VDTGVSGGCIAGRKLREGFVKELIAPVPLCPVPREYIDAAVTDATESLQAVQSFGWEQPATFLWRVCAVDDPVSDECDPTADPTRDNALAFATVFLVQCVAIALGHVVLMWKLRRMVNEHKENRRRAMGDPRLEQRARRFVAAAKAQAESERRSGGEGKKLSAKARFRRAGIVAKFSARAMKAAREAPPVDSVDDVVLEISEAVAMHWKVSLPYFVVARHGRDGAHLCIGVPCRGRTVVI